MSIRRNPGEIVTKKTGAGFTNQEFKVKIPTLEDFQKAGFKYSSVMEDYDSCLLNCGDPDCREFANILVVQEDGSIDYDEWVYHVSECLLE